MSAQVLNSLLYWLLDLTYKEMLLGEEIKPWDPEPYILRRPGVEARMVEQVARMRACAGAGACACACASACACLCLCMCIRLTRACARAMVEQVARMGHLIQLLCLSEHTQSLRGDELLLQVKEVETTTTLLASIRSSCADSCPEVLAAYDEAMASTDLTLQVRGREISRLPCPSLPFPRPLFPSLTRPTARCSGSRRSSSRRSVRCSGSRASSWPPARRRCAAPCPSGATPSCSS